MYIYSQISGTEYCLLFYFLSWGGIAFFPLLPSTFSVSQLLLVQSHFSTSSSRRVLQLLDVPPTSG